MRDRLPFDPDYDDAGDDSIVTFRASIPPIASAVTLDGAGDGMRVKLDIPGTDVDAGLALVRAMAGRSFRVVIVRDDDEGGS